MSTLNRRALKSNMYLLVQDITFPPADAGAEWAVGDEAIFTGTLEETAIFAVKNFAVLSTLIQEQYSIVWDRNWEVVEGYEVTPITLLGAVHVTPDEVTLFAELTNQYRRSLTESVYAVLELKADATERVWYKGSLASVVSLMYQLRDGLLTRYYEDYNIALYDATKAAQMGVVADDILGAYGPVEIEKAHPTLLLSVANANVLR